MSPEKIPAGYALVRLADRTVYWHSEGFDPSILNSPGSQIGCWLEGLQEATDPEVKTYCLSSEGLKFTAHPFRLAGADVALLVTQPLGDERGRLPQMARDDLTGLASRGALESRLSELVESGNSGQGVGLLFIDLDRFKEVNDRYGHLVGDEVLATVGHRLADMVREGDFVARFGGDEFVILVEGADETRQLIPLVERLCHALERPIETSAGIVQIGASLGIAVSTEGFDSPRAWLAAGDQRMYDQKRRGGA